MGLSEDERAKLLSVWGIEPGPMSGGPSVLVGLWGTFVRRISPEEARALAMRLLDVADEAEGFGESRTEPSPPGK